MIINGKVLVIDDSPFIYNAVRRALEPYGFVVVGHAENGLQGLEMIDSLQPDIVTLNITMPVMDGLEVASRLSGEVAARVVMLSAIADIELLRQAYHYGIQHFLQKPFQPDDLIEEVKKVMGVL